MGEDIAFGFGKFNPSFGKAFDNSNISIANSNPF